MAVNFPPDHPLSIEMAKWNKPWVYVEYPRCMYKAQTLPGGKASVSETNDNLFGGGTGAAEAFTKSCQHTVRSDDEKAKALEAGWRLTQDEALSFREARDKAIADETAVRHYNERLMSEKAQAEAAAADAASFEHLPEIVEQPKNRGGRPRKVQAEA